MSQNIMTEDEYMELPIQDAQSYSRGWKARANKESFDLKKDIFWKRGFLDAEHDASLQSEEMMR